MIPIGEYMPDVAYTNGGVSLAILNAIAQADGTGVAYGPQPGPALITDSATALPDTPRGIFSFVASDGSHKVIGGTETKLYLMNNSGVWSEIGSGYSVPSGHQWSAAQFNNFAVFTNTTDGQQAFDLDLGGMFSAVTDAPKARFVFGLFGSLAALDCDGDNRVIRTSKVNDHTVWTGPGTNFQTVNEGGELLAGGEVTPNYALVAQRNGWQVLERRPDRYLFNRSKLVGDVGALNPEVVVFTNGAGFTWDTVGCHRVTPAGTEPIGDGKVNRTFLANLATNGRNTVQGAYDPEFGRVLWRYQDNAVASETLFENVLAYHPTLQKFVPLEIETYALVSLATPAYTLEDLDTISMSIEGLPYSLDSAFWKGGRPRLGIMGSDLKFAFLAGDSLACTLECGRQVSPTTQLIRSCVPDTDCENATVQVGVSDRISSGLSWGTASAIVRSGRAMLRGKGKNFALRFNAAAGEVWSFMRGFRDLDASAGGVR